MWWAQWVPITNLGSLNLLLNFISLSVHTLRAVVLKPLLGEVTPAGATWLLAGATAAATLPVDRHGRHPGGQLGGRAHRHRNRRRCGSWSCSSKRVWATGGRRHPTHCSLAQQTTRGQSAGYTPTLSCYKATTSSPPPAGATHSLHQLISLTPSLYLKYFPILCISLL